MSPDAILNQTEPIVILTAHATKVNQIEPNWTEPQTCLACQNHAFTVFVYGSWICIFLYEYIWKQQTIYSNNNVKSKVKPSFCVPI